MKNVQTLSFFWSALLRVWTEDRKPKNTDQKKLHTYIFHALEYLAETRILPYFIRKREHNE